MLDTTLFEVYLIDVYTVLGVGCTAGTLYICQIYICQKVDSLEHNIGILNSLAWWCIYMQKNSGVYRTVNFVKSGGCLCLTVLIIASLQR
jgi:hypothetical protein